MIPVAGLVLALSAPVHAAEVSVSATGHASNPAWSPDGNWVAFEVNDYAGTIDLYVVAVSGASASGSPRKAQLPGASSQFGGGGSVASGPVWHPDPSQAGTLVFEGSSAGSDSRLYFMNAGGAAPGQLLTTGQIAGDLTWPTFSPDGSRLAFVSDATGDGDVYAWSTSSGKVEQVVSSPFSEMSPGFDAAGSVLVFSRKNQGGEDLFVMDGGRSVPRIGGNGDQTRPRFGVGQDVVYFSSARGDDHWDLVVSSGPGSRTTLAKDVRLPIRSKPAITGDGRWVAWGSALPEKASSIYLTRTDGSKTVAIATGLVAAGEPALLSKDGRTFLAFTALPSEGADWRSLHLLDISNQVQ